MGTDEARTESLGPVSGVILGQNKTTNKQNERKNMNNQFDELTKSLAQSVTRRAALKKFGVGLVGMALACFGLANKADAARGGCKPRGTKCRKHSACCSGFCQFGFSSTGLGICS